MRAGVVRFVLHVIAVCECDMLCYDALCLFMLGYASMLCMCVIICMYVMYAMYVCTYVCMLSRYVH